MATHARVDRQQWVVEEKTERFFFSERHSVVGLLIRVTDICENYIVTHWTRTYIFPSIHW
jgi:hypothetical protein